MKVKDLHSFEANSMGQWKKALQKELGERDIESLRWSPGLGLEMDPYYMDSTIQADLDVVTQPFLIHQTTQAETAVDSNRIALECLAGGAQSVGFSARPEIHELEKFLDSVEWPFIELHWRNFPLTLSHGRALLDYVQQRGWNPKELKGLIGLNAESLWLENVDLEGLCFFQKEFPGCRLFYVDGIKLANSGANATQQVIAILSQAQEAIHMMVQAGVTIDQASALIQLDTQVSSSYFLEITKVRSLRFLFAKIVEAYQPVHKCSKNVWIHCSTGGIGYMSIDTNSNLLRATTAAMSASLGQASSIEVGVHHGNVSDQNGLRWSRNILHLMREESYFDKATSAAKGSYYLENMFSQLAHQAWQSFVDYEEKGGWLNQQESWHAAAKAEHVKEEEAISSGKKIKVGVNKYQAKPNV